jgi:hypothetical protein
MADLKIDIATVFSGKKAFADASKSTLGLNKQVNTLAKSFLGLFTAQKLARAGFNAAKAFAADDKAARVLSRSLDNLGLSFADPAVKTFIADLEKQFGVLDDQLRPAFQRLLTTTGDVTKSQQLLRTALNLSAASGVDVVTVSGDLSKAYVGQTRALAKYGIGLTQAELKAMSFEEVQTRINTLFGGQAQNAVDTYAGSFDKLNVATANASETIGKGFIDALTILGGGGASGLNNIIAKIDAASNAMASFARGTATAFKVLDTILNLQFTRIPGIFAKPAPQATITPAIAAELKKAAIEKASLKRSKEQTVAITKQTKAIKEQTALQKAGTLFDVEQTQIIAALKGKISDDERKRLELQLALLTGNTTEASKLAGEIGKAQGLSAGLIAYLKNLPDAKNPFAGWAAYLDAIQAQVRAIAVSAVPNVVSSGVTSNFGDIGLGDMTDFIPANPSFNKAFPATVKVDLYVDGTMLADAITVKQTNDSLSGNKISINRRSGSFAETPTP